MPRILTLPIKIIISLAATLGIGATFLPSVFGFVLFRSDDYFIVNEHQKPLEAFIFRKNQTSENEKTHELIVYLPTEKKYNYLTIVPAHQLIGLADQADKNIWVLPGKRIAYMFPNGSFFTPLDGPFLGYITEFEFSKDVIWFNTFDHLKKFGNRIVIQKRPGQ